MAAAAAAAASAAACDSSSARGVHTFTCEGFVASDQAHALRFTFRVFADGALTVEISPRANAMDKARPRAVDLLCHAYDGRAVPPSMPLGHNKERVFQCSFKLVRFWRHQLQSQFLVCHGSLSASKGLQGRYVVVHGDDDGRPHAHQVALPVTLQLLPVQHTYAQLEIPMRPLTPGTYTLRGFTVTLSGTVYECIVELQLRSNGAVVGTSHDLLFPQRCELRGKWRADEVEYTLAYKLGQGSSRYLYTMTPSLGGLRGRWAHEDPMRGQRRTERGHVELRLERATRVWSTAFHALYPREFRRATKLLLHCAALPSALWQHVLSFCDFHHFVHDALDDAL